MFKQGCALRKMEVRPVVSTCKIKGAHHDLYQNSQISSPPETKS